MKVLLILSAIAIIACYAINPPDSPDYKIWLDWKRDNMDPTKLTDDGKKAFNVATEVIIKLKEPFVFLQAGDHRVPISNEERKIIEEWKLWSSITEPYSIYHELNKREVLSTSSTTEETSISASSLTVEYYYGVLNETETASFETDQPPTEIIVIHEDISTATIVIISTFSGIILVFIFIALMIYLYKMGRFNLIKLWCKQCIGNIKSKLPHRYNQVSKHEVSEDMIREEEVV